MAVAEKLGPEAEQAVARIVRSHLEKFEGISIDEVKVVPSEDEFGDPYHHILVVYSGSGDLLEPGWLNSFTRLNRESLAKWGVEFTTECYIEAAEYQEWLEGRHED